MGRGLGETFPTAQYVGSPHVGLIYFLLKGGLPLFSIAIYYLLVAAPKEYWKAVWAPQASERRSKLAARIAIPGILAMSALQALSGWLSDVTAPGIGLALSFLVYIRAESGSSLFPVGEAKRVPRDEAGLHSRMLLKTR